MCVCIYIYIYIYIWTVHLRTCICNITHGYLLTHVYPVLSDSISPAEFRKGNFRKINIEFGDCIELGSHSVVAYSLRFASVRISLVW